MTEEEWLASINPQQMLEFLRGRASDRKTRLYAVACCRQGWNMLDEERSRKAVEVGERYADGEASDEELHAIWEAIQLLKEEAVATSDFSQAAWLRGTQSAVYGEAIRGAHYTPYSFSGKSKCDLLRDVFGNPVRPVRLDRSCLAWGQGTLTRVAQAVYDERAFDCLHILADALEDAGCTNAEILTHCRGPGPHVRGCWALDLILGKK